MHISRARLVPAILLLACAACADSSGRSVTLLHYDAVVPADWSAGEPGSEMRLAEFDAGDGAEIVVFYFGPGQGGSVEANVTRWEGQLFGPTSAVEAEREAFLAFLKSLDTGDA